VDAKNGYDEAVGKADYPNIAAWLSRMRKMHAEAADHVKQFLLDRGDQAEEGGSFMSTVNKWVVDARSGITGLNPAALTAFVAGERRLLKKYDASLNDPAIDESGRDKRLAQSSQIEKAIADAEALHAR
jgi:Domain of unknown function (DUF2383)